MSYGEPESFTIFGFAVKCTAEQQREITQQFRESEEFRRWHALDSLLKTQHACSDVLETFKEQLVQARATAAQLAAAEVALSSVVSRIVAEVTAS